MSGCIVQVYFESENEGSSRPPPFNIIETELPDFATFCEMVDGDRLIAGAVLSTHRELQDGYKVIKARQPIAFRGAAVMRCLLPRWKFAEEDV